MNTFPSSLIISDRFNNTGFVSRRETAEELLIGGNSGQAESVGRGCEILVEARVAMRDRQFERVSGFLVPSVVPLKVSSDKLGKVAEIYRKAHRFDPQNASAGVIVTNPTPTSGTGTGFITVVWTASQVGLAGQANWWVNPASPHPIPTNGLLMGVGNTTVTFGPLAGYTAPAPVLIHIWKGQTTTLTVTYGQP